MSRFLIAAILAAQVLALCIGAPAHAAEYQATPASVTQSIPKLHAGDSLCLLPGAYGPVAVQLLSLASGQATLKSCASPVTIPGLALYGTHGLVVSGIDLDARKVAGVRCYACVRVTFDRVRVTGVQPNAGITIDGGSQIVVTNSAAAGTRNGVNLGRGVDGWRVENFDVSGFTDGVFIANSPNGVVRGLTCHDAHSLPGDHDDCVQSTTKGGTKPLANLRIENIRSDRGAGDPTQGVFIADEGLMGYRNVQISNVRVIDSLYNAAYLENADAASSVSGVCAAGVSYPAGIFRRGVAKVTGNRANVYKFAPVDPSNATIPQASTQAQALALCP